MDLTLINFDSPTDRRTFLADLKPTLLDVSIHIQGSEWYAT